MTQGALKDSNIKTCCALRRPTLPLQLVLRSALFRCYPTLTRENSGAPKKYNHAYFILDIRHKIHYYREAALLEQNAL